jgi:hypothetical protein
MKTNRLGTFSLQLHIALTRFGWGNGIAGLLCAVAAAIWLWAVPYLHERAKIQHQALVHAQQALQTAAQPAPPPAPAPAVQHLAAFYEVLGEAGYAEQQVKTLFALAAKTGLTLNQAEYKLAQDKNGRYQTYQILLPLKGDYQSIRQFCEQTLLAIPFASLDEINFKRDAIASHALEAKLHFTLYLNSAPRTRTDATAGWTS